MKLTIALLLLASAATSGAAQAINLHAECMGAPESRDFLTQLFCGLAHRGVITRSQKLKDFRVHYAACEKDFIKTIGATVDNFTACLSAFSIEQTATTIDPNSTGGQELSRIKGKCLSDWPDDFKMQAYCVDKQVGAARRLATRARPPDIPQIPYMQIVVKCRKEWPEDWSMMEYCTNQQYEAVRKLR
jgi:hypothetical protein